MTTLRTAAQQALEALELGYDSAKAEADQYHAAMAGYRPQRHAAMDADVQQIASAITALRAALAEPVLNPAPGYCKHCKQYTIEEPLPAEPVQEPLPAEPVQEPVAWFYQNMYTEQEYLVWKKGTGGRNWTPLYTVPPQRKPLTEEEIDSIWDSEKAFADIYAIARAIERAHGIV